MTCVCHSVQPTPGTSSCPERSSSSNKGLCSGALIHSWALMNYGDLLFFSIVGASLFKRILGHKRPSLCLIFFLLSLVMSIVALFRGCEQDLERRSSGEGEGVRVVLFGCVCQCALFKGSPWSTDYQARQRLHPSSSGDLPDPLDPTSTLKPPLFQAGGG